jgi:hypothetical protein
MKSDTTFPVLLTRFFSERLIQQRHASPIRSVPTAIAFACCSSLPKGSSERNRHT